MYYDKATRSYRATRRLTANTTVRLPFAGDPFRRPAVSPAVSVRARVRLWRPAVPTRVKRAVRFTVSGHLRPRHSGITRLRFYRYEKGRWKLYRSVRARNVPHGARTGYKLRYKLPRAVRWYVRAHHADASHAPTQSPARRFVVR